MGQGTVCVFFGKVGAFPTVYMLISNLTALVPGYLYTEC